MHGRKFKLRDGRTWGQPDAALDVQDPTGATCRSGSGAGCISRKRRPEGWRLYFRRFALEHWYRFAKSSLGWTLPRLQTPAAAERWSDLMPLLTWQLWLARLAVKDRLSSLA
jgi:hypothetical protein